MSKALEIHLIEHAEIASMNLPDGSVRAGDLLVYLRGGEVLCMRNIPRAEFERAIEEMPPERREALFAPEQRLPDDHPDVRLQDQVLEELERRFPDLLESWRRRHHK